MERLLTMDKEQFISQTRAEVRQILGEVADAVIAAIIQPHPSTLITSVSIAVQVCNPTTVTLLHHDREILFSIELQHTLDFYLIFA